MYEYMCICMYIYVYIYAYVYKCIYMYTCIHKYVFIHISIYIYTYIHVCTLESEACLCMDIHVQTYVYIYSFTCILYMYIYECRCRCRYTQMAICMWLCTSCKEQCVILIESLSGIPIANIQVYNTPQHPHTHTHKHTRAIYVLPHTYTAGRIWSISATNDSAQPIAKCQLLLSASQRGFRVAFAGRYQTNLYSK